MENSRDIRTIFEKQKTEHALFLKLKKDPIYSIQISSSYIGCVNKNRRICVIKSKNQEKYNSIKKKLKTLSKTVTADHIMSCSLLILRIYSILRFSKERERKKYKILVVKERDFYIINEEDCNQKCVFVLVIELKKLCKNIAERQRQRERAFTEQEEEVSCFSFFIPPSLTLFTPFLSFLLISVFNNSVMKKKP